MKRQNLLKSVGLAFALVGMVSLTGCTTPPPAAAPASGDQSSTVGTITFTGGAVAVGIGYQWGSGTLSFRGREYPVRVSGISVVDVGAAKTTATGTVRNLRNLADFNGNYVAVSIGATVAAGGSVGTLRNQNGVTIEGVSTAQGLRFTVAPSGINITLSQ